MVNGDPTSMTPSRVQTFWSQRERALDYYDKRITHFEVHLTGSDAASNVGLDDIHCALAARPVGLELVVVIDPAGTTHQANHGALGRLELALAGAFEKRDPRTPRTPSTGRTFRRLSIISATGTVVTASNANRAQSTVRR